MGTDPIVDMIFVMDYDVNLLKMTHILKTPNKKVVKLGARLPNEDNVCNFSFKSYVLYFQTDSAIFQMNIEGASVAEWLESLIR